MTIKTLLLVIGCTILATVAFGQKKKQPFAPNNKILMGYSVLFPPIRAGDHAPNILQRAPFHGVNMGYERKLLPHFSANAIAHFTFGEQNGETSPYASPPYAIRITRFRQIDVDFRLYTSRQLQGFFVGGGWAFLKSNLFVTESGTTQPHRNELNGNILLGYSQTFHQKWFVRLQGATAFWSEGLSESSVKERVEYYRHTLSFQTGLLF